MSGLPNGSDSNPNGRDGKNNQNGQLKKSPLSNSCPVPIDQIPIKEYESMSDSWFYRWGLQGWRGYVGPIVSLWLLSWVVVGPMAAVSFVPTKLPPQFVISGSLGALLLPTLALIQLYIGWRHVGDRLLKPAVPYEESGWYDGQIWQKPQAVIDRDRLIADYQIKPLMLRLQKTFATISGIIAFCLVTWQFL